jgi:hypothetical protein
MHLYNKQSHFATSGGYAQTHHDKGNPKPQGFESFN